MEDDGRAVVAEHLPHALLLLAVGEHRDGVERVAVLDELSLDLEQVVLGVVEKDERSGPTRAIWRHSSAPTEPPAPVTSTVRPVR